MRLFFSAKILPLGLVISTWAASDGPLMGQVQPAPITSTGNEPTPALAALSHGLAESSSTDSTIGPELREQVGTSRFLLAVIKAKTDLLAYFRDSSEMRLAWYPLGNPGTDSDAVAQGSDGYLFWHFDAPVVDDQFVSVSALQALAVIVGHFREAHVNLHCIVLSHATLSGDTSKRYVTFDSDPNGILLQPHVSVSPPRPSLARRREIEGIFREREALREQRDNPPSIDPADEKAVRSWHTARKSLEAKLERADAQIPGVRGLGDQLQSLLKARTAWNCCRLVRQPKTPRWHGSRSSRRHAMPRNIRRPSTAFAKMPARA